MCKILANAPKLVMTVKLFLKSLIQKFPVTTKLSQIGHFLLYRLFEGGQFSSVHLEVGVHTRLREIAGTAVLYPSNKGHHPPLLPHRHALAGPQ